MGSHFNSHGIQRSFAASTIPNPIIQKPAFICSIRNKCYSLPTNWMQISTHVTKTLYNYYCFPIVFWMTSIAATASPLSTKVKWGNRRPDATVAIQRLVWEEQHKVARQPPTEVPIDWTEVKGMILLLSRPQQLKQKTPLFSEIMIDSGMILVVCLVLTQRHPRVLCSEITSRR